MSRLHEIAKSIIVATAIATAIYILMNFIAITVAKADWPRRRVTAPRGIGPVAVPKPVRGPMVVPRGSSYRGVGGYYWHKPSKTWRHDGGTHPDTNYHESNKEREYLQLEDPEGVWERTHAR